MTDPFSKIARPSLDGPATSVTLVVPNDGVDLAKVAKQLRIYNGESAAATIKLLTHDGEEVTLTVPPTSLLYEDIVTKRVFATGTTATLEIHGYSD